MLFSKICTIAGLCSHCHNTRRHPQSSYNLNVHHLSLKSKKEYSKASACQRLRHVLIIGNDASRRGVKISPPWSGANTASMLQSCMRLCMTCTSRRSARQAQAKLRSLATSPTASVTSLRVLPAPSAQYNSCCMSHPSECVALSVLQTSEPCCHVWPALLACSIAGMVAFLFVLAHCCLPGKGIGAKCVVNRSEHWRILQLVSCVPAEKLLQICDRHTAMCQS